MAYVTCSLDYGTYATEVPQPQQTLARHVHLGCNLASSDRKTAGFRESFYY